MNTLLFQMSSMLRVVPVQKNCVSMTEEVRQAGTHNILHCTHVLLFAHHAMRLVKPPVPDELMHPHNMILPPPCFTIFHAQRVGQLFVLTPASVERPIGALLLNFDQSLQSTHDQSSVGQSACSLAKANLFFLFSGIIQAGSLTATQLCNPKDCKRCTVRRKRRTSLSSASSA